MIAGDLYDWTWRDYKTGLFFAEQIGRLNQARIPVFLLHGNHDAQSQITKPLVLPDNVKVFGIRRAKTFQIEELNVALHGLPHQSHQRHGARRDPCVLDGLLYHESDLRIEEHYTDTTGFTDHVFALMHLLGFRFAPRIRDLADKRLYIHGDAKRYPTLARLIGGSVNVKRIRAHWDAILRLAASIQQGTVTASLMLRKLGSYPRQNGLALALRELGRIERTLFTLDWLQDIELRRRVQIGLNKGEAKNALARAVFFNRLGELRDRSFENQRYRTSGLNLVVAAIVLWNTAYLERVVQALRDTGNADNSLLPHLSPLGWEH